MHKAKFVLSKKHEWLIDKLYEIPEPWERNLSPSSLSRGQNARNETVIILMQTIKKLTENTQMEGSARELLDKAQRVFDYTSEDNN